MDQFKETYGFTEEEWEGCIKVLSVLKEHPFQNPDNRLLGTLVTKIVKKVKKGKVRGHKEAVLDIANQSVLAKNAIEKRSYYGNEDHDKEHHFTQTTTAKKCYACNTPYHQVHSFYHRLCPNCTALNLEHRWKEKDLKGRHVILTGGRVKVGYATALKVLRAGAHLTLTTRFPALAHKNLKKEDDYEQWADRLIIYGLDLRLIGDLEAFVQFYSERHAHLDILINNAAQTIKYPEDYYAPIIEKEQQLLSNSSSLRVELLANRRLGDQKLLSQVGRLEELELSRFGQPIDQREKNSWNSKLEDIDPLELLEANLINQISPFMLIKAMTPLFKKSPFDARFIVNVSSSEGQFSYSNKTDFHPHTNMTKAALNMMTRTSARDYAAHGIFMNSVDVGWISTGAHENLRKKQFAAGYIPPLDSVDGAARILHPIFEMLEGNSTFIGELLKNYQIEAW